MTEPNLDPRAATDVWAERLAQEFGLAQDQLPVDPILDLTRDIAYGVARPAAPFTAYVVGLVAGMAGGSSAAIEQAVEKALDMLEKSED